ncbi:hypothetical protein [Plebeiibacterium sediminum]|uniref:Tetratricopeptide repeat protein n=1 Tax=Plebeiibacterium sediminum TaxID=2992112 RepID=A0AAE3SHN8_9BACT|nr:hypothetical protein [Plebeiobacterium sediminum]MCW3789452.1 hypothetical protein [Plebeiobacterium sediminum]
MKSLKNIIVAALLGLGLFSCNPLKQLQTEQLGAENQYAQGNFAVAYEKYSSLIEKYQQANLEVPYSFYVNAAISASKLSNYENAIKNYNFALIDSVTLNSVKGLIDATENTSGNNLSTVLNKYADYLKANGAAEYYNTKVFDNEVRNGNQDNIVSSFANLSKPTESQSMVYINALETLGKKKDAIQFCSDLVKENPDYYKAREYKAMYYYDFAENWYKNEMAKYNKDKNYTAYVYLKRELKKVSANFRIAKDEFEVLHKQYPDEKKYVRYLKNTYIRLDMKKEAAELDKLL